MKTIGFFLLLLSFNVLSSEITTLVECKYASFDGLKTVEIAKIGDAIGANLEGGPYGYFFTEIAENTLIKATETSFSFSSTTDTFALVKFDLETGRGRILQRLLPSFYNCMSGGNPNACLVFNEVLQSCKRRDYTPSLF